MGIFFVVFAVDGNGGVVEFRCLVNVTFCSYGVCNHHCLCWRAKPQTFSVMKKTLNIIEAVSISLWELCTVHISVHWEFIVFLVHSSMLMYNLCQPIKLAYICVLLNSLNWMKLLSAKIKKEQISKEIKLHFCWTNWMNITIYFFNLTENRSGKPFEAIFLFAPIFNLIFPIVFRGMILQWQ